LVQRQLDIEMNTQYRNAKHLILAAATAAAVASSYAAHAQTNNNGRVQRYAVPQSQGMPEWHVTPPTPAPERIPWGRDSAPSPKAEAWHDKPPPHAALATPATPATPASSKLDVYDPENEYGFFNATQETIPANIGHHFWVLGSLLTFCPPEEHCVKEPTLPRGSIGLTVLGLVRHPTYQFIAEAKVELSDGTIAFVRLPSDTWWNDKQWKAGNAKVAAERETCRRAPPVAIGMTEQQAASSKWGNPQHVNTTETVSGTRAQWVRSTGPHCDTDGTVNHNDPTHTYLYFDNGVASKAGSSS
jgi:hypothetical protein